MQLLATLLLLLDLDRPQPLDALALGNWGVVVALMRVDLGDAQGEEREREELECVFEGGTVGDLGEKSVLGASLLVGWALEGAKGALDLVVSVVGRGQEWAKEQLTLEHVLALVVQYTRPRLQVLALEEIGDSDGSWVRRARSNRLRLPLGGGLTSATALLLLLLCPLLLLLLEHLYEFGDRDALLRGVGSELALHHLDLLRGRLLPRLHWGRAAWTRHFGCAGLLWSCAREKGTGVSVCTCVALLSGGVVVSVAWL